MASSLQDIASLMEAHRLYEAKARLRELAAVNPNVYGLAEQGARVDKLVQRVERLCERGRQHEADGDLIGAHDCLSQALRLATDWPQLDADLEGIRYKRDLAEQLLCDARQKHATGELARARALGDRALALHEAAPAIRHFREQVLADMGALTADRRQRRLVFLALGSGTALAGLFLVWWLTAGNAEARNRNAEIRRASAEIAEHINHRQYFSALAASDAVLASVRHASPAAPPSDAVARIEHLRAQAAQHIAATLADEQAAASFIDAGQYEPALVRLDAAEKGVQPFTASDAAAVAWLERLRTHRVRAEQALRVEREHRMAALQAAYARFREAAQQIDDVMGAGVMPNVYAERMVPLESAFSEIDGESSAQLDAARSALEACRHVQVVWAQPQAEPIGTKRQDVSVAMQRASEAIRAFLTRTSRQARPETDTPQSGARQD